MSKEKLVYVTCDKCKGRFPLSTVEIRTGKAVINGKNYEVDYFMCSNCAALYKVCVHDEKSRFLGQEIEDIKRIIGKEKSTYVKKALHNRFLEKQKERKKYLDSINQGVDGVITINDDITADFDLIYTVKSEKE